MDKIYLVEDHNQALDIWRRRKVRNLDLVHIDAHIDFGFHLIRPMATILQDARNLKELTNRLEQNILFLRYEDDFDKQTNIGNYIYPAIQENIVKDFYWVVPGGVKEFRASTDIIKKNFASILRRQANSRDKNIRPLIKIKNGLCQTQLCGRKIIVCPLEKLPVIKKPVLLDIDTDFLVVPSLRMADNTCAIGKRKPWISPKSLVETTKDKIKTPRLTTIAYSVNNGYTPMKYKHLGDEVAYHLDPVRFRGYLRQRQMAAGFFNSFLSGGKKTDYQRAIRYHSGYAANDNNYGPLYLNLKKYGLARKEFRKILRADPGHAGANLGLAILAIKDKRRKTARVHLDLTLKSLKSDIRSPALKKNLKGVCNQARIKLAEIELASGNLGRAKSLARRYLRETTFSPSPYYILGRIYEKEGSAEEAIRAYKSALAMGLNEVIDTLERILKISIANKKNGDIFNYVVPRFLRFKKSFFLSGKGRRQNPRLRRDQRKMAARIKGFEKMIISKKGVLSEG